MFVSVLAGVCSLGFDCLVVVCRFLMCGWIRFWFLWICRFGSLKGVCCQCFDLTEWFTILLLFVVL